MSNTPRVPFSKTLEVRDSCLCLFAQRAARSLARRFDIALKPLGLTNQQFSLMMTLNRPDPASLGPLAKFLGMDRTTLTAALKPLARNGWVEVMPDPKDRRGRLLRLTDEGAAILAAAVPIWDQVHSALEDGFSGDAQLVRDGLAELSALAMARLPSVRED